MGVGSAIIGFLSALPDITKMIQSFMTWVQKVSGNDPAGVIKNLTAGFTALNAASTPAEIEAAAKSIADSIAGKL